MNSFATIVDAPSLDKAKVLLDTHLAELFSERRIQARKVSPQYEALWTAIEKLYTSGGKRLRPYIAILCYHAFGGDNTEKMLPVASALELIHQAMLIHDDIIDRDTIRYGVKNLTGQYEDTYRDLIADDNERRHFAESSALLAGDLLISEAHMQIARSGFDQDQIAMAQNLLSSAVFHVAGGELIDTEASFRGNDAVDPLTIAIEKTASYSFITPLTIGAFLGGATQHDLTALKNLGRVTGIGFQLRDDIIGIFGDEVITGKSADGDLREGKRTLLVEEFHACATDEQKKSFAKTFGNQKATQNELQVLRELIETTGTKTSIENLIQQYNDQADKLISTLSITPQNKAIFHELVKRCLFRNK